MTTQELDCRVAVNTRLPGRFKYGAWNSSSLLSRTNDLTSAVGDCTSREASCLKAARRGEYLECRGQLGTELSPQRVEALAENVSGLVGAGLDLLHERGHQATMKVVEVAVLLRDERLTNEPSDLQKQAGIQAGRQAAAVITRQTHLQHA